LSRPVASSDAILLRRVDYGEADQIVTLLCRDLGKLSAVARAARKSRRRFGGALELATISRVEMTRKSGAELWTLSSARPVRSFGSIAADLGAFAHASYGTELLRELSPVEVPDPTIFDLGGELFETLARRGAIPFVLRCFELRLLEACGLAPVLERCLACGTDAVERAAIMDPNRGGVVCADCAAQSRGLDVRPISNAARLHLVAAAAAPSLDHAAANVPDQGAREARDIVLATILGHIGKPLKSVEFIAKMAAGPRPV
jgi:DNA repair protein RecO (recombination protein O)